MWFLSKPESLLCSLRLNSFSRNLPLFINELDVCLLLFPLFKVDTHVFIPITHRLPDQLPSSGVWLTTKPFHVTKHVMKDQLKSFSITIDGFEEGKLFFLVSNKKKLNSEKGALLYASIFDLAQFYGTHFSIFTLFSVYVWRPLFISNILF